MSAFPSIPLAQARQPLNQARDRFAQWTPRNHRPSFSDKVQDDVAKHRPHLLLPLTLAAQSGPNLTPTTHLVVPDNDGWRFQPTLFAWPSVTVTFAGKYLWELPVFEAEIGLEIWILADWVLIPPSGSFLRQLGCTGAALFIGEPAAENDNSAITSQTTRRWKHRLGVLAADGLAQQFASPFYPPSWQPF